MECGRGSGRGAPPDGGASKGSNDDHDELATVSPRPKLERSRSLALKNFQKWQETPAYNGTIYRFVPMKLPFDGSAEPPHDMKTIKQAWPNARLIIDLQNQDDKYEVDAYDIRHVRVRMESKAYPTMNEIRAFQKVADDFFASEEGLAAVHCHYGYNRTGFQICSYLIERLNYSVSEAIEAFAAARPPGIRHQHYKDELHRRYENGTHTEDFSSSNGIAME